MISILITASFQMGIDYILDYHRRVISSSQVHQHLVVERLPYPIITELGNSLRIVHVYFGFFLYLQRLTEAIDSFHYQLRTKIFRIFPQFGGVALYTGLANFLLLSYKDNF
jgi:hypothetical protein